MSNNSEHVFRVDKFVVSKSARDEFLSMVRMTHEFLKTLPGLVQDFVLEQSSGPGEFNFVTFAEWETAAAIESAKSALMARLREMNLNPEEMLVRLGIKSDMGNYNLVPKKSHEMSKRPRRRSERHFEESTWISFDLMSIR